MLGIAVFVLFAFIKSLLQMITKCDGEFSIKKLNRALKLCIMLRRRAVAFFLTVTISGILLSEIFFHSEACITVYLGENSMIYPLTAFSSRFPCTSAASLEEYYGRLKKRIHITPAETCSARFFTRRLRCCSSWRALNPSFDKISGKNYCLSI
jgi:hypothetical protein